MNYYLLDYECPHCQYSPKKNILKLNFQTIDLSDIFIIVKNVSNQRDRQI